MIIEIKFAIYCRPSNLSLSLLSISLSVIFTAMEAVALVSK